MAQRIYSMNSISRSAKWMHVGPRSVFGVRRHLCKNYIWQLLSLFEQSGGGPRTAVGVDCDITTCQTSVPLALPPPRCHALRACNKKTDTREKNRPYCEITGAGAALTAQSSPTTGYAVNGMLMSRAQRPTCSRIPTTHESRMAGNDALRSWRQLPSEGALGPIVASYA